MGVRVRAAVTLALATFFAASCGGVTDPSKNQVENIPGTLNPGATVCTSVTVNNGGEYSVKITALQPTPTAVLSVGWYQGANCTLLQELRYAQLNQLALSGAILQKGAYSVSVGDPGTLTVTQTFTVQVSHP